MVKCRSVNHDHPWNSGGGKHHLFLRKTATNIKIFRQTRIEESKKKTRGKKPESSRDWRSVETKCRIFSNGSFLFFFTHNSSSPPNSRLEEISKSFRSSAERWHWNISLDAAEAIILAQARPETSLCEWRKFSKLKYRMLKMKTKNWSTYFEKKKTFVYVKMKSE